MRQSLTVITRHSPHRQTTHTHTHTHTDTHTHTHTHFTHVRGASTKIRTPGVPCLHGRWRQRKTPRRTTIWPSQNVSWREHFHFFWTGEVSVNLWSGRLLSYMRCVPVTGDTEIKTPTFFLGIRTVPKRMWERRENEEKNERFEIWLSFETDLRRNERIKRNFLRPERDETMLRERGFNWYLFFVFVLVPSRPGIV